MTWAVPARAHDGSHAEMPNQVTAGVVPLWVAARDGSHPALDSAIDEVSLASIGVTLGYGYTFVRHLECRVRAEYIKPFSGRESLRDGLHTFRGVVGVSGILPIYGDALQLGLGPEVGAAIWRLTEFEAEDVAPAHAVGYTLSFAASLRGWVTYHTGFWLELGFGVADGTGGDPATELVIAERWPLRVGIGWADRF